MATPSWKREAARRPWRSCAASARIWSCWTSTCPTSEGWRPVEKSATSPTCPLSCSPLGRDKVRALDAGADDYVVKPYGMEELLARIRAALRRASPAEPTPPFISPELQIDFEQRRVTVKGQPVRLTPKEFELLRHLATNPGKPVSHRRLLQAVWGPDYGNETEYLRVFINQLRKKIEPDPSNPRYIRTDPWVGYRFEPPREALSKGRRSQG